MINQLVNELLMNHIVAVYSISFVAFTVWNIKKIIEYQQEEQPTNIHPVEQPQPKETIQRTFTCSHCGKEGNLYTNDTSQTLRMRLQLCNKCMKEVRFK